MLGKCGHGGDAVRSLILPAVWITVCACALGVRGQDGNGCGHTLLGAESGTLATQNYPGTYPSHAWCTWRLRVPEGRTLRLLFGDIDIETSPECSNGSLMITASDGASSLGPVCGKLEASLRNVTFTSNEVTVAFSSGSHRSGRGFLLSYTTDLNPDLVSCLHRGSHFTLQQFSAFCPAGCKDVAGDVWGNSEQGYRDTSVLCKAAIHAGAASDSLGGRVTVSRGRSLTLYESTFANGILSKMGSLSEKKLLFSRECNNVLVVSGVNASSFSGEKDRNGDSADEFLHWETERNDPNPWLELELSDRRTITGIITMGSNEFYAESYILHFSKDRKNWKLYKDPLSREKKVFAAHSDGHLRVLNSLSPPAVARFVRLQPLSWHGRAAARVKVLGCAVAKVTPRSRQAGETPSIKVDFGTSPPTSNPTESAVVVKETRPGSSQAVMVAVGVVLGLIMCISCLMAGVWWKRRKKDLQMKCSLPPIACQSFPGKSIPCTHSELISYPLERSVHDALPNPPLNDYAEPGVAAIGQKVGSTFRPGSNEGYTAPFTFNHYDTPGNLPEYAEPLPPEPEYATPFSDQALESNLAGAAGGAHGHTHRLPMQAPITATRTALRHARYDCPSHRVLSNGYCTPALHAHGPRPASVVYAEPKSCDALLQKHTYEEPL
ncbi:discoidin, CUB and LCCL domain-containing protein 1 [Genypterus blacodes]|uniref:discoidin, CUB and LCCL domain-containing protein 1 n=1 Tax=Genypterus blacodes TaxID=154954 RepID=UPI003F75C8F8